MNSFLAGSAQIQATLTQLGGTVIGQDDSELLYQMVVLAANLMD